MLVFVPPFPCLQHLLNLPEHCNVLFHTLNFFLVECAQDLFPFPNLELVHGIRNLVLHLTDQKQLLSPVTPVPHLEGSFVVAYSDPITLVELVLPAVFLSQLVFFPSVPVQAAEHLTLIFNGSGGSSGGIFILK